MTTKRFQLRRVRLLCHLQQKSARIRIHRRPQHPLADLLQVVQKELISDGHQGDGPIQSIPVMMMMYWWLLFRTVATTTATATAKHVDFRSPARVDVLHHRDEGIVGTVGYFDLRTPRGALAKAGHKHGAEAVRNKGENEFVAEDPLALHEEGDVREFFVVVKVTQATVEELKAGWFRHVHEGRGVRIQDEEVV